MALFAAFGLMSFKLSTTNSNSPQWWEVGDFDGTGYPILVSQGNIPEPDGTDCEIELEEEPCAVEMEGTPPAYLHLINPSTPIRTAGKVEN